MVQQEGTGDWAAKADELGTGRSGDAVGRRYEKLTAVKTEPQTAEPKPQPEKPKKQQLAPIYYWSGAQVEAWLVEELGLGKVAEAAGGEVDGATAAEAEKDDWRELGATGMQAAKIVGALKKLLVEDDSPGA
eukprot:SAG31_NODE_599_length_13649_cov_9.930775_15_plen_132_part_00